jgi:hypothetical protein
LTYVHSKRSENRNSDKFHSEIHKKTAGEDMLNGQATPGYKEREDIVSEIRAD